MQDQHRLKLGFVGAGEMATWSVLPALQFAAFDLMAICDVDEPRLRDAAARFGARASYSDYRSMLDEQTLDAVVVQMHPRPRHDIVLAALDAGCHVFVPKPPAQTLREAVELADAAERANRILMVNFQRRFSFAVKKAQDIIRRSSFGKLTQISCSFCSGLFTGKRGHEYDDPVHAFCLDMAPHHLDLARHLAGEIESMALFHRRDGDGIALAINVKFRNGAVGTLQLNSNRIWWRNYDRIEITGQGEYVVLDDLWSIRHYRETQNSFTENWSDERSVELTGDGPSLVEFHAAIREGRAPLCAMRDAVETMRLYDAVYDAVTTNRSGVIFEQ